MSTHRINHFILTSVTIGGARIDDRRYWTGCTLALGGALLLYVLAVDGNTSGDFSGARSTTHTETSTDPWWEVDLKESSPIDRLVIWNRTDGRPEELKNFRVRVLDEKRGTAFEKTIEACGGYGEAVEDPAELPKALERALKKVHDGQQALLNVRTAQGRG